MHLNRLVSLTFTHPNTAATPPPIFPYPTRDSWAPPPTLTLGSGMAADTPAARPMVGSIDATRRAAEARRDQEIAAAAELARRQREMAHRAAEGSAVENGEDEHASMGEWQRIKDQTRVILTNKVYVTVVFGYAALSFVTGGFAYFGIQFMQKQYDWDAGSAGLVFGGITAFTGIVGTGFGGFYIDRQRRKAVRVAELAEDNVFLIAFLTISFMELGMFGDCNARFLV
jgi:hypothetical protein